MFSSSIFYRCVPDNVPEFLTSLVAFVNNLDTISRVLSDIYVCRYAIIGLSFLAVCKFFVCFVVNVCATFPVTNIAFYSCFIHHCVADSLRCKRCGVHHQYCRGIIFSW